MKDTYLEIQEFLWIASRINSEERIHTRQAIVTMQHAKHTDQLKAGKQNEQITCKWMTGCKLLYQEPSWKPEDSCWIYLMMCKESNYQARTLILVKIFFKDKGKINFRKIKAQRPSLHLILKVFFSRKWSCVKSNLRRKEKIYKKKVILDGRSDLQVNKKKRKSGRHIGKSE